MTILRWVKTVQILGAGIITAGIAAACGGSKQPIMNAEPMPAEPIAEAPVATPAPTAAPQPAAPQMTIEEMVKKNASDRDAAWAAHDVKKAMAFYTADATIGTAGPMGWEESKPADMEKNLGGFFSAFPDVKMATTRIIAKGNVAVAEWVVSGTNTGDLMGEKPTGKKMAHRGASMIWFTDDGKVKRENMYMDTPTMLGQLGKGQKGQKFRAVESITSSPTEWLFAKAGDEAMEPTAKGLYAAWAKKDSKAGFAMFNDDIVLANQYDPADVKGRKDAEKWIGEGMKAFSDDKYDVKTCLAAASYVACELVWTATWTGPAMGMKPTKKTGTVHVIEILKMRDGKVSQVTAYGNGLEFAATFGLLPDPKKGDKPGATPGATSTKDKATPAAKEPKPAPAPPAPPAPKPAANAPKPAAKK